MTPVQEAVLDPAVEGRDLLVSAQTGSGKTLGFGLAIAPQILGDHDEFSKASAPLGLVIAPTRELALQVKRELSWLFEGAGGILASCVGGMDMRDERRALARGAHLVVATPGRLRDHIMRGTIDLSQLKSLVLDEADEMLDLGFREDLEFILGEAPDRRQTLLFSATVPNSIAKLAKTYQRDALRIVTKSEASQHADISYKAFNVSDRDTENAVINTLLYFEAPNAIVFGNTRAMVNRMTTRLSNRGFQVVALSGELSQTERTHALQAMRDGRARVCVATDVAARGIDLPNLDLVVHAELPSNHETLLHRSGRTGRAGRKGVSALIVTKKTRKKAERILNTAKVKAEWTNAPSAAEIGTQQEERMLNEATWETPVAESEQDTVGKLATKFSSEQLAAAYLRVFRSVRSAPEELSDVDAKAPPREDFGASVWFSISGGRDAGAEPRRILPMICKSSGLSRDDIGAIRIQRDASYVQIKAASGPMLLASLGADATLEKGAVVTQLDKPPVFERSSRPPSKPHRKSGGKRREPASEAKSKPSSAPIDWNDAPPARTKKPKPQDRVQSRKGKKGKPADRNAGDGSQSNSRRQSDDSGAVTTKKPKSKSLVTPKGKPNSKKNKARALAARANEAPKRKRGSSN